MRLVVTGATGCLGRNLVLRLLKDGFEVHAIGRNLQIGKCLEDQGAKFYNNDIRDLNALNSICNEKDIVFHCAALTSLWGKYEDFYSINVLGTENILKASIKNKVGRFIYVSSPSIYFDFKDKYNISESEPISKVPVNYYISTKILAEEVVNSHSQFLPIISLRPRAIFGAYDNNLLPRILKLASRGWLPLINKGKAVIDITYVDNVVECLLLCINSSESTFGKYYNITNAEQITVKELFSIICTKLDLQVAFKNIPYKVAYYYAAILEYIASIRKDMNEPLVTKYSIGAIGLSQTLDISAAKRDLGYRPLITLDDGINNYINWYLENNGA